MHYYKRNLGDYAKKAGRLSMLQHGAYTLLLDACYDRERFPTEAEAIEWTWASTSEEEQAVKFVLSRFFDPQDDKTFVQPRVYEELQVYKIGEIQNRLIALSREGKKQQREDFAKECDQLRAEIKNDPLRKTHEAWTSVVDALIKKHEAPPNHKPITTNHKPITNNKNIPSTSAEGAADENQGDSDPPKKPKSSKYKFESDHFQLAIELSNPVKQQFPKMDIKLEEWADAVRKLITIDGYTREQIYHLWRWRTDHVGNNGFTWSQNCRTPMKLRQKKDGLSYFEIMKNQMLQEKNHATNQSPGTSATGRKPSLIERVEANVKQRQQDRAARKIRDVDGEIVAETD